ncbi:glutathione S-transferase [Fistulifera solaris]|uniref:Glutathione S-transferase n=1 Tax=Fistulifera solaris TaxID=1519565 RepID=A0A1Z5JT15_FISSO|nr:glutathione S-transferase [Fistulifera solaris]|eukprot:GAX17002.1 glutathione S-transferase [Fistulifera solaris]
MITSSSRWLITLSSFFLSFACGLNMPESSPVRLITNKMCPFAQKAWLALECSQIPYEMEEISLYGAGGKPDWFWKLNPAGTVPVLVQEMASATKVWPDSDLILQAIGAGEVVCDNNVLQMTESQRNDVDEWRKQINEMLPTGKKAVLGSGNTSELAKMLQDNLESKLSSQDTDYLVGNAVTIADCHAFPFLWRLDQEFGLATGLNCPKLGAWVERRSKQPEFRKTIQSAWWWW